MANTLYSQIHCRSKKEITAATCSFKEKIVRKSKASIWKILHKRKNKQMIGMDPNLRTTKLCPKDVVYYQASSKANRSPHDSKHAKKNSGLLVLVVLKTTYQSSSYAVHDCWKMSTGLCATVHTSHGMYIFVTL